MNRGRPGDIDPRYRQAAYIGDAVTSAILANKLARKKVRQGVPPDEAAYQTGLALMVAGPLGWLAITTIGFVAVAIFSLAHGEWLGLWPCGLMISYNLYAGLCIQTYIHVPPHLRNAKQIGRANLWRICLLLLGWWPAFILASLGPGLLFRTPGL
jgi:hypothetical protein